MGMHSDKLYKYKDQKGVVHMVRANNKPTAAFKLDLWDYKEIAKVRQVITATKRKAFSLIEFMILLAIGGILLSIGLDLLHPTKKANPNKFVVNHNVTTQEEPAAKAPATAAPVETPDLTEYIITDFGGRMIRCAYGNESNCGINLTGCEDGYKYWCLQGVKEKEKE